MNDNNISLLRIPSMLIELKQCRTCLVNIFIGRGFKRRYFSVEKDLSSTMQYARLAIKLPISPLEYIVETRFA